MLYEYKKTNYHIYDINMNMLFRKPRMRCVYVDVYTAWGYEFPEDFMDIVRLELGHLWNRTYKSPECYRLIEIYSNLLLHVRHGKLYKNELGFERGNTTGHCASYRVVFNRRIKDHKISAISSMRRFCLL